jgi:hypothetical protein
MNDRVHTREGLGGGDFPQRIPGVGPFQVRNPPLGRGWISRQGYQAVAPAMELVREPPPDESSHPGY